MVLTCEILNAKNFTVSPFYSFVEMIGLSGCYDVPGKRNNVALLHISFLHKSNWTELSILQRLSNSAQKNSLTRLVFITEAGNVQLGSL